LVLVHSLEPLAKRRIAESLLEQRKRKRNRYRPVRHAETCEVRRLITQNQRPKAEAGGRRNLSFAKLLVALSYLRMPVSPADVYAIRRNLGMIKQVCG
jgi:hypothetical protein